MRLLLVIAALLVVMITTFALGGAEIESLVAGDAALEWYRGHGVMGGAAIAALLVADVLLPIPTTPLLTLLGSLYGPLMGGALGSAGSLLSGLAAYAIARGAPRRFTERLLGRRDLARLEAHFRGQSGGQSEESVRPPARGRSWSQGGWTVALSRWLPMLPEIVALLAGLAGMPFSRFLLALLCGTIPMAFAFAALGAGLADRPGGPMLATLIAAVVPALLWPVVRLLAPAPPRPASPVPRV